MKLKLGDRVHAPAGLLRRRIWKGRHEWYRNSSSVEGIFVGERTYANGTCSGGMGYDDPMVFEGDEWIKVALICRDARTKPIPVLYNECEVVI